MKLTAENSKGEKMKYRLARSMKECMKTIVSFHTKDENNISSELLSIPFSIFCTRACLKNKNCTKRMFYFPFHDKIKKKGGSLC